MLRCHTNCLIIIISSSSNSSSSKLSDLSRHACFESCMQLVDEALCNAVTCV